MSSQLVQKAEHLRPGDEFRAVAGVYRLLARLWISEIDLPLLQRLQQADWKEHFEQAGGYIPERIDEETIDQLAIEYCQTFLGPRDHFPPHQSIWMAGTFQGDCVASMRNYLDVVGELDGVFADQSLVDHTGVQFAVMGKICAAAAESNEESLLDLLELAQGFFQDHLQWIIRYCHVAQTRVASRFYQAILRMTAEFLQQESASRLT